MGSQVKKKTKQSLIYSKNFIFAQHGWRIPRIGSMCLYLHGIVNLCLNLAHSAQTQEYYHHGAIVQNKYGIL
jgi:hypothetical protein